MADEILDLLKTHDYFRGIEEDILRKLVAISQRLNFDIAVDVLQPGEPLDHIGFVLIGRLKAVQIDPQGNEHFVKIIERGDQYGMMLGALGENLPFRIVALEPSTTIKLDHDKAIELIIEHPDLHRHWLRTYAGTMKRFFFKETPPTQASIEIMLHESPETFKVAYSVIGRLKQMGEDICILSNNGSWQSIPNIRFRPLHESGRLLSIDGIRQQIAEWHQAKRIVVDVQADEIQDLLVLMMKLDRILVFVQPKNISSMLNRLRKIDIQSSGWRDKISLVWLLDEGHTTSPTVPELRRLVGREFIISVSRFPLPWGKVPSLGLERLIHHLRGIKIGLALGGGAARGMAHLGVLKALEQHGIVADMIAGTSAGAMTGALYAAGYDCDYLAKRFTADLSLPWLFRKLPNGGYWYLLYKYRLGQFDPMLRNYLRDLKLEQLPLPCLTVTVDLVSSQTVVRDQGDVVHAILESINLPGLSLPICRDGKALIDGGIMNNVPADVLTNAGCNFVIAVNVTANIKRQFAGNTPNASTAEMKTPSTLQTLLRTTEVQNYALNVPSMKTADLVIEPDVADFDLAEFMRAQEFAEIGEKEVLKHIGTIKQLLTRLDPKLL